MTTASETVTVDVLVVGGGIVGLATARHLLELRPGLRLTLLEKEPGLARHQTGRNSGVIHSGLYYKPGSAKARLCREGRERLLPFCREHSIPHELTGKLVVASDESEIPRLEELLRRGTGNGLLGVRRVGPAEIREIEPAARGIEGLFVPETGIVDYVAVCRALASRIRSGGGTVTTSRGVLGIGGDSRTKTVTTADGTVEAGFVVGCGGLWSDRLARQDGLDPGCAIVPFRGEYHELVPEARGLVRGLIYPVPDPEYPFLGVHLTRGIDGSVHAGPNAVPAPGRDAYTNDRIDFDDLLETIRFPGFRRFAKRHYRMGISELRRSLSKRLFAESLRKLVPAIEDSMLIPAPAGIRAQAMNPDGTLVDDFLFAGGERSLHVLNAPSPAATASLAIGREIAERVLARID